jgi:hypothetical protein
MMPPFWGPPAGGLTVPDPIIWWFVAPVLGYATAIWWAFFIALWMEAAREIREERDE